MLITARIDNRFGENLVSVQTEGNRQSIVIPAKASGWGSAVNGGELLFLALATCACNDIYREAARRNITIRSVNVTVSGAFGKEGEPAENINYSVTIDSDSEEAELQQLITHVDSIAEVHNTLRKGVAVQLNRISF